MDCALPLPPFLLQRGCITQKKIHLLLSMQKMQERTDSIDSASIVTSTQANTTVIYIAN